MASYEDNDDYNDCVDSINDKVKSCDCYTLLLGLVFHGKARL